MLVRNVQKWVHKHNLSLLLVFISLNSFSFSQNKIKETSLHRFHHSLFITQSFQKMDNFSSLSSMLQSNKITISSSLGIGLNRTIYQHRFFPQLQFGFGYSLLLLKKGSISPELSLLLSTFSTLERHYFSSIHAGYLFTYGSRWVFIHRFNAGLLNEKFVNSFNRLSSANTIGWQFSIGVGYAFE